MSRSPNVKHQNFSLMSFGSLKTVLMDTDRYTDLCLYPLELNSKLYHHIRTNSITTKMVASLKTVFDGATWASYHDDFNLYVGKNP